MIDNVRDPLRYCLGPPCVSSNASDDQLNI